MKKLSIFIISCFAINFAHTQNWTMLDPKVTNSNLSCVYFVNSNTGYIVGDAGIILKTSDAGTTWIIQPSGTNTMLHSVFFIDVNTGFVAGDYRTRVKNMV